MRAFAWQKRFLLVTAFCTAFATDRVLADALVVTRAMTASTIAEIFVDESEIRVEIEIGAADIEAFRNILPDESYEKLTGEATPFEDRARTFFENDWTIRGDDRRLPGTIERIVPAKRMVRDEITGDPLPTQPDDAEVVIRLALRYALDGQPKTLSICPPLDSDTNAAAANIGFVVYHRGVAVNDFRYLSAEETLQLDWSDPWYSAFDRKTLRRRYFAPAAAFLYVENLEVRKEIIFRPKDLQTWVDLGLEGQAVIKADARDGVLEKAAEFLAEHTPVQIDGRSVDGTLDRVHFIKRTLRTSGVVEPGEDIGIHTALIGAIYIYPIESLPQQVTMGWNLFNERISQIPAVATDEAGGLPTTVEPDDPTLVWQNYLTHPSQPAFMEVQPPPGPRRVAIPVVCVLSFGILAMGWIRRLLRASAGQTRRWQPVVVSIVLIAIAVLTARWPIWTVTMPGTTSRQVAASDAAAVTHSLLHNVYRAFDYRDESTIYDVLDRSVSGELLTKIYLDTQRSLTLASQGGARVKVTDLELIDCQAQPAEDQVGFLADCTWTVTGSVGHWGHIHQRINQYRAEFVVRPLDGQWKMTDMQLLSEERL
jgi:hypothetical protein